MEYPYTIKLNRALFESLVIIELVT